MKNEYETQEITVSENYCQGCLKKKKKSKIVFPVLGLETLQNA